MTLNETLLQKLAKWRPTGRQTLDVTAADAAWRVSVSADRCDALGCLSPKATCLDAPVSTSASIINLVSSSVACERQ